MEANRSSPVFFNDKVLQHTSVHAMQWQVESSDREFQFSKQFQFSFSWIIPKFAVPGINILLLSEFHGTGNPKTRGTIFLSALYYYCLELWQSVLKDTYNKPNFNVLLLCMMISSNCGHPPGIWLLRNIKSPGYALRGGEGDRSLIWLIHYPIIEIVTLQICTFLVKHWFGSLQALIWQITWNIVDKPSSFRFTKTYT